MSLPHLNPSEKTTLLQLARDTLYLWVNDGKKPDPTAYDITDRLKVKQAVFSSLFIDKDLRGCLGNITPKIPLYSAVMDETIGAATHDPRFPPVKNEEVDQISISLSLLTQPQQIQEYHRIDVSKHGVILIKEDHHAVFLPKVATEYGWSLTTLLTQLSLKAGLSENDWQHDAHFFIFESQDLSEHSSV